MTRLRRIKPGVEPRLRTRVDAFGHKWLGHNIDHPAASATSLFFPSEGLKPRRLQTETPCHIIAMSSRCNRLAKDRNQLRSTLSASTMVRSASLILPRLTREDRAVVHLEHRPRPPRSHYRRHASPIQADLSRSGPFPVGNRKAIIIHSSDRYQNPTRPSAFALSGSSAVRADCSTIRHGSGRCWGGCVRKPLREVTWLASTRLIAQLIDKLRTGLTMLRSHQRSHKLKAEKFAMSREHRPFKSSELPNPNMLGRSPCTYHAGCPRCALNGAAL